MSPEKCSITAGFLDYPERKLFHLLLRPSALPARGSVLFLHPFAEEMHKSRRNVSAAARLLAQSGYNVLLPDLSGCGDGSGEFSQATWSLWVEDATRALGVLADLEQVPVSIWGLRLGALLATQLAGNRSDISQLLLWQPVLNGEQQIDQFIRLETAANMLDGSGVFDRKTLWNELREGRSLEVAGYELSSELALGIAKIRLNDLTPQCPVKWLEVGSASSVALPSNNVIAHWEERGLQVESHVVAGQPFWRTHDSAINKELQDATLAMLKNHE